MSEPATIIGYSFAHLRKKWRQIGLYFDVYHVAVKRAGG